MKKSIKRISSLMLSLVMLASAMPMAFATDKTITENDMTNNEASDTVDITINVDERYSFSFPDAVSISSETLETTGVQQVNLTINRLNLAVDSLIDVEVSGTGYREQGAQQDDPTKIKCTNSSAANDILLGFYGNQRSRSLSCNSGHTALAVGLVLADAHQLENKAAGNYVGTMNVSFTYSKVANEPSEP